MLADAKKDCIAYASLLGDYQSIGINELADGYCKALDDDDEYYQNCYLSALVLRFWYTIDKMYQKSSNIGLERGDFFSWLVEAINYACKYRAWQNPSRKINAQSCINQCINTIRLQHYYEYNLDKHRANYNNLSLDTKVGNNEDDPTFFELYADVPAESSGGYSMVYDLVQTYINNKKIIEAIIFDTIAYNDCQRQNKVVVREVDEETGETKKYTRYSSEFWPYRLVQILGNLSDNYPNYFMNKYRIIPAELTAAIDAIKRATNQKLYKYVDSALEDARASFAN